MTVERYLLGELNSDERTRFEEHAFDCDECAAAVRDGIALFDNGRALVEGERRFRWGRVMTWAPSAVAAALAVVVGMQHFAPAVQTAAPAIQVLHGYQLEQSRGAARPHLPAGKAAVLYANIADQSYPSYGCELRDAGGHVLGTQQVTAVDAKETVPVLLRPLPAGSYVLVVYGVRADGNRGAEVANESFDVGP